MTPEKLFELYKKERDYEKLCFGDYEDVKSLNLASFIIFLRNYLNEVEKAYSGPWQNQLPEWLTSCKEMEEGSTPVRCYEQLIKVFALAGAALESYCNIDPEKWRENLEEDSKKWKE
jgi:hypothetical protein